MRFICCILLVPVLHAADVRLAWDRSPDTVGGYALLWGPAGAALTQRVDAGTNLTATITAPPGVWHAVCIAYANTGLESDPSNGVIWTNHPAGPTVGRAIRIHAERMIIGY
jgi:hypothetical protein